MRAIITSLLLAACVACVSAADNQLTAREQAEGWKLLFDGKSAKGWRNLKKQGLPEKGWVVENGALKLEPKSRGGDLISVEKYEQFDLKWEWRIPAGSNNGLKYFIIEERGGIGHEYQMIDDKATKSAPKHRTASFYDVLAPAEDKPLKAPGEWNQSRVVVQGKKAEHWLNGEKVLEYELGSPELKAAIQKSKFKDVKGFGELTQGHILLTDHSDQVEYKNIKILPLD